MTFSMSKATEKNGISQSFEPLVGQRIHTLILGTMPGKKSLQLQQYYAHPRNALWPIVCALVTGDKPRYDIHHQLTYEQRCDLVTGAGFALWDVLETCERPGSLDGAIVRKTEQPNAIADLISVHPELHTIVCNGRTAEALFKRHIQAQLDASARDVQDPLVVCVPSTSPAMASLSLDDKFSIWQESLNVARHM